MKAKTDSISILRKFVYNNIPNFDDEFEVSPNVQNDWIKLYDFVCVDHAWANTVQNYDLEHDSNYSNNGNKIGANFYITSSYQESAPPYDIKTGDFIVYHQGKTLFIWRIVKINQSRMFADCAVYELICDMFQPKEKDIPLSAGMLETVEVENGKIKDDFEDEDKSESGSGESGNESTGGES